MNYHEFVLQLQERLRAELGEEASVELHQVMKNNDIRRDTFLITGKESHISPAVYLEEYYHAFQAGMELPKIAEEIQKLYRKCCSQKKWDTSVFLDFEKIKEKIFCKLIHRDRNQELLKDVPFVSYLDLAVVFYCVPGENFGSGTILIHRSHMELWKVSEQKLYQTARENTKRLLPCSIYKMSDILEEITERQEEPGTPIETLPMYVLTNERRCLGACGILYDSVLEEAAAKIGERFYVIPSSIHECILIPEEQAAAKEELEAMVRDINRTQVLPEEVLSDRIYHYDGKKHHLIM